MQDPTRLGDAELDARIVELGRARARLDGMMAQALAEKQSRDGHHAAVDVLRWRLKLSSTQAQAETKLAEALADGLGDTMAAMAAGEIHAAHARVIINAQGNEDYHNETELLRMAATEPPDRLRRMVRKWWSPDPDSNARTQRQYENRAASFKRQDDGTWELWGRFDTDTGKMISLGIAGMMRHLKVCESTRSSLPDQRAPQQRRADAIARLLIGADPHKVEHATVIVTAEVDTETNTIGRFRYDDGTPVANERLGPVLANANLVPAVFDTTGRPLWIGRAQRAATAAQRLALAARDGGCVGCDTPAEHCDAHHIKWWSQGGTTDIDNLALVCPNCHNQIHKGGTKIRPDPNHPATYQLTPPPQHAKAA